MSLRDQFGNTPLHYATMFSKTFTFLYLHLTLRENYNIAGLHGTLQQLAGQTDCAEIVQTIMHDSELRPWVLQALFFYALQKANLKLIKVILKLAYKEVSDQIWTQCFTFIKQQPLHPGNQT